MTPIEIGLAIAIAAAIGWGFTHKAKVAALTDHVTLLQNLIGKAPAVVAPVAAAPAPVAVAVPAPPVAANSVAAAAPAPLVNTGLPPSVLVALTPVAAAPNFDPGAVHPLPPTLPARNPASNAPAGFPDTSPGGYPLWYALGGDGKPVGAARIIYDGNTFDSESEIAAYRAAVAQRNLNLAAYQAPAFVGSVPMSGLTLDDWCFIDARADLPWGVILAGDSDMFRAKTIDAYYNGLAKFNPATYAGQLKGFATPAV